MTFQNASPGTSADVGRTSASQEPLSLPAPPSWPWRRGALLLAGAAQLVTIGAVLNRVDPLPVTWAALLLAIAPAPLAAAAAFAPAPANRPAAVAALGVLIAGIVGAAILLPSGRSGVVSSTGARIGARSRAVPRRRGR